MTVEAIITFTDAHGKLRKEGDRWVMSCQECALALIRAGKVKRVRMPVKA